MQNLSDKQILEQICTNFGINITDLAEKIHVNRNVLYNVTNGRSPLTAENKKKIVDTFPNINPNWILTGSGQMIIGDNVNIESNTNNTAASLETIGLLVQTNAELVQVNKELSTQLIDYIKLLKERQ